MAQKKSFMELEFKDAFLFAATLEDEELCRDVLERILEISIRSVKVHKVFLSTCGTKEKEVSPELVSFLHFVEKSSAGAPEGTDPMLDRLRNRIAYLKQSRRLEERYMLFGEMLDDERAAGRMEGHREGRIVGRCEGLEEGIALIEAMLADHKEADIPRTRKDPIFRMEMMEYYHIAEPQKQI